MIQALCRFVQRFAGLIVSQLSCFDRVIFKGYLPMCEAGRLEKFVDYILGMPRKDFMAFAQEQSDRLVAHAQRLAREAPGGYRFLQQRCRKDELARSIIREHRIAEGLICVLCVMETCPGFRLRYGKGRPRFANAWRRQRVVYFYYLDRDLGLMHVRLATWFPFTIQVAVNGHEWLARQLQRKRMGFELRDNAFVELDDPKRVQKIADRFIRQRWRQRLDRIARRVNPLLGEPWMKHWNRYYWVTDQAEYATDFVFKSREALAGLYPRLLEHATLNFSARDILTFLGRRLHPRFDGEVLTDCKHDRAPGARIKHRMKNNWLKMYDKFGLILRIETVINNPREFKVRRRRQRGGQMRMTWCPMNKGIANLYRYQQVARAANARYADALSVVADPAPAYRQLRPLAQPKTVKGRSYAPFNPARDHDVRLFAAVLDGDHHLRGFRNADIRHALFGQPPGPAAGRAEQRRRQSRAVTRLLKRLHVRGLLAKVPHSRRWYVTTRGQQLLAAAVRLYHRDLPQQLQQQAA